MPWSNFFPMKSVFLQQTEAIQKDIFWLGASQFQISHCQERLSSFQRAGGALERMRSSLVFIFCLMAHFAPLVWVPEYSVGLNRGLLVSSENTWTNSIYGMTVIYKKNVQLHSQKHWITDGRCEPEPGVHLYLFFTSKKTIHQFIWN